MSDFVIDVEYSELLKGVRFVESALPLKPQLPVLAGVQLKTINKDQLQLTTFDYETFSKMSIPCEAPEGINEVIPGAKFFGLVQNALKSPNCKIEKNGHKIKISENNNNHKSQFELPTFENENFPQTPEKATEIGKISASVLVEAINQVATAAGRDDNQPSLVSINAEINGETITLLATDRYRIARKVINWEPADVNIKTNFLLKKTAWAKISKTLDQGQKVSIFTDNTEKPTRVGFGGLNHEASTQTVDATFPAVEKIFVDEYANTIIAQKDELIGAVKAVSFVKDKANAITLTFDEKTVTVEAGADDAEKGSIEIACSNKTAVKEQTALNPDYLSQALGAIEEAEVAISFNELSRAIELNGIIKSEKEGGNTRSTLYRHVMVPVVR